MILLGWIGRQTILSFFWTKRPVYPVQGGLGYSLIGFDRVSARTGRVLDLIGFIEHQGANMVSILCSDA